MLWLFIIFLVGGSYVLYRYRSVSNKKIFFQSSFFRSLTGSAFILLLVILSVNLFAPRSGRNYYNPIVIKDTLAASSMDTSTRYLLLQDTKFHYERIKKVNGDYDYFEYVKALQENYHRFALADDNDISSLGNFCLGVMSMQEENKDQAYSYFHKVTNDQLPYLHFCLGELFFKEGKEKEAAAEYLQELQIEKGNRVTSFVNLIGMYKEDRDYESLHKLLQYDLANSYFPDHLARETLLQAGDFNKYLIRTVGTVFHRINWMGFVAALLISVIWLIYISRLNIFKRGKFIYLLSMFLGGSICVFIVLPFSDSVTMFTQWSINGGFFNDLFYSIFIIGVPEEFVKILPLLLVPLFSKGLQDPVDYIVYGSASALGFAFVENLLYFDQIRDGIIHGRAYLSVIGHMADTSFVAYGIVLSVFKLKKKKTLIYVLPLSFLFASVVHGLYDFFLFHEMILMFFIFFIFIIQLWILVINNCLNNSTRFSYKLAPRTEQSRLFLTLALTSIFALEYMVVGFSSYVEVANIQLVRNATTACFLIIFFSTNLSSFDLMKGYWRNINFVDHEKRGYGSREARTLLTSWYFVNAVQSHNYVGLNVQVYNDPYNKTLGAILEGAYQGRIVNRITLYENNSEDPYWFLVKMTRILPFTADRPDYILVKLRFQEDSLVYEDEVQVFFKAIADAAELRNAKPQKEDFPFYGWAYMKLDASIVSVSG